MADNEYRQGRWARGDYVFKLIAHLEETGWEVEYYSWEQEGGPQDGKSKGFTGRCMTREGVRQFLEFACRAVGAGALNAPTVREVVDACKLPS